LSTLTIAFTETSYQTAPLAEYDPALLDRAASLFRRVARLVGPGRTKRHRGSFSVLAASNDSTAAKIVIYESGIGKMNGPDPQLADGVYVLIRLPANAAGRTLAVAPQHHERFAYFTLASGQDLDEMADFIATCAGAQ
jgi:hypothetical protein